MIIGLAQSQQKREGMLKNISQKELKSKADQAYILSKHSIRNVFDAKNMVQAHMKVAQHTKGALVQGLAVQKERQGGKARPEDVQLTDCPYKRTDFLTKRSLRRPMSNEIDEKPTGLDTLRRPEPVSHSRIANQKFSQIRNKLLSRQSGQDLIRNGRSIPLLNQMMTEPDNFDQHHLSYVDINLSATNRKGSQKISNRYIHSRSKNSRNDNPYTQSSKDEKLAEVYRQMSLSSFIFNRNSASQL